MTPCFLRGSEDLGAEWRAASVRGQLRWWLRAIAGADRPLEEVRRVEDELFGDTGRGSMVRLRTRPGAGLVPSRDLQTLQPTDLNAAALAGRWADPGAAARLRIRSPKGLEMSSNPVFYLAFGAITGGALNRSFLPPGAKGFLDVTWVRTPGDELRRLFDQSLWAWLHLGGIGAKCRKGFGSVQRLPAGSRQDFVDRMKSMLPRWSQAQPDPQWTRFSPGSRIFLGAKEERTWQDALSLLGGWLIAFRRRYGHPGETRPALKNRDYEWLDPASPHQFASFPDRTGFGLPLPFRRRNRQTDRTENEMVIWNSGQGDARRASPLLLHVAQVESGYLPVLTYLPARFLPAGAQLSFKRRRNRPPDNPLISTVVARFLDDLQAKKLVEEVTP
ncbi:MAG TPA: type III-B CRISPR module RAMP protein Cmr1 [Thermoanaerobaculia bacterium]|nr:type III-B CRISPR module RAMP protein Cmr1 [Thermoanaerobaculia bacterium]